MDRFNEPIVITPLSDGKTWKLLSDLRYEVGGPDSDDVIKVPVGFYTDFASIPHMFRRFLPRWGKYGYASIIHDFLYWERKKKRLEADKIFLEADSIECSCGQEVSYLLGCPRIWLVGMVAKQATECLGYEPINR